MKTYKTHIKRLICLAVILLLMLLPVYGCGKKGPPVPKRLVDGSGHTDFHSRQWWV